VYCVISHFWDRPVPNFSDVRFSYLALVQDKKIMCVLPANACCTVMSTPQFSMLFLFKINNLLTFSRRSCKQCELFLLHVNQKINSVFLCIARFPCLALLPLSYGILNPMVNWTRCRFTSMVYWTPLLTFMSIKKVIPYFCVLHEGYYVMIWLIVRICVFIKDWKLI
jgi:hypothetical protein